jgi:hypothetical protein
MSTYKRDPVTGDLIPIANKSVIMTGATSSTNGTAGNVPAPVAGDQDKVLTGGGSWKADTAKLTTAFTTADNASDAAIIVGSGETTMAALTSGTTHGGLFRIISKSILNTRRLINTVKRIWATVATSWASGETYAVGDVRLWTNGHTYVCKQAHTSSSSLTPANTTYWEDKSIGDMIYSLNSNYTKITNFSHRTEIATSNTTTETIKTIPNINNYQYLFILEYSGATLFFGQYIPVGVFKLCQVFSIYDGKANAQVLYVDSTHLKIKSAYDGRTLSVEGIN